MIDILLVEDHRELAQLIVSFLKRDGFQVHHVELSLIHIYPALMQRNRPVYLRSLLQA